jgi:segregation and condensation protein A
LSYQIILPQFEGPFDLLLFFIERDELDIYDIPIHKLTNDFLHYVQRMEQLNVEVASEFILVAATLMRIKSKLLLPKKEVDAAGNEIDPRQELVNKLLEYKRYKEIVEVLKAMEEDRHLRDKRGNISSENKMLAELSVDEAELESVTMYKLMKAFNRVMQRYQQKADQPQHTVIAYPYTIEHQKAWLSGFFIKKNKASFADIFSLQENRIHAVFTFLAMLELIQTGALHLLLGEGINNFWLGPAPFNQ